MQVDYGFLIEEGHNPIQSDFIKIRFLRRKEGNQYPINCNTEGETGAYGATKKQEGMLLDDLVLLCYINNLGKPWIPVPTVHYEGIHYLDYTKADKAFQTLKRAKKAIDKANANELGDMLIALCKEFGLVFYAKKVFGTSSQYSECEWYFGPTIEGRDDARIMLRKLERQLY